MAMVFQRNQIKRIKQLHLIIALKPSQQLILSTLDEIDNKYFDHVFVIFLCITICS